MRALSMVGMLWLCWVLPACGQQVVRIGILGNSSGPFSTAAKSELDAAQMAASEFEQRSAGTKVEFKFSDHQGKPDLAVNIVRGWIDKDGVDSVLLEGGRSVLIPVAFLAREKKKTLISMSAAIPQDAQSSQSTVINWTYNDQLLAMTLTNFLMNESRYDVSTISPDTINARALEKGVGLMVSTLGGRMGENSHYVSPANWPGLTTSLANPAVLIFGFPASLGEILNRLNIPNTKGRFAVGSPFPLPDVAQIGLARIEGVTFATSFYWDANDATRDWSKRFMSFSANRSRTSSEPPDMSQAGIYSAVRHYLRAVTEVRGTDADRVAEKMKSLPVDDSFAPQGRVRENGQLEHPVYIVQVKAQKESRYPGDYLKVLDVVKGPAAQEAACGTPCPKSGACPQRSAQADCPCPKSGACPQ